ncbi:MAG: DUF2442 domain-containing protein [Ferruginibacter sp.]|nr:DUF2442 domain-containing protein [Cytophagales bacterium]
MHSSKDKIVNKRAADGLDRLIHEDGLRIQQVYFNRELDLMMVLLNNRKIIKRAISGFASLRQATHQQLTNFENDGVGIHWPDLDEDLSLRGFLAYEVAHVDQPLSS